MATITRLAILNRGTPAMRLLQAAREYATERDRDVRTIAVHTDAERDALVAREADEAVSLGAYAVPTATGMRSALLDLDLVEAALVASRADAAWVGWGPLAQDPRLAECCERLGITYVGPDAATLARLGDPAVLADLAAQAGVALADPAVVERGYARHLDVLVVADGRGSAWAVGVHDGTLQRRTEKVLVETATPALTGMDVAGVRAVATLIATRVGFSGAGTVTFVVEDGVAGPELLRISAGLPLGHGATEITTGLDLAKLQLHVAEGGRLEGAPPPVDGHAVAVRLNAEDAEHAFSAAPGTVALLQLPTGPGLRIDIGVVEGDAVLADIDPTVAEVVAWGRDREEARVRLHRALSQFPVVLDGGVTNKGFLLDLLDRPEVLSGRYDTGWLDRLAAAGETAGIRHGALAVLIAAVDAYDAEQALDREHFFASARRGRPAAKVEIGHVVELRHRGHEYRLAVSRNGRRHYRVAVDGSVTELLVTRLGRFQSRVVHDGRAYRVVSAVQGGDLLVEVDGVPHRSSRVDGGVVRAPTPGVVVAVPAAVGAEVRAGDTLVVLESMKMETPVEAPFAGRVRAVLAGANVQVESGAPLVQLEAAVSGSRGPVGERLSFDAASGKGQATLEERARADLDTLYHAVLGYDVTAAEAKRATTELVEVRRGLNPGSPELLRGELAVLSAFADLRALFRSHGELAEADLQVRSPQEHLHAFLRSLDTDGLPPGFVAQLRRALAHYGIEGPDALAHTPALEQALYWIFQSRQRESTQVPAVVELLNRWLDPPGELDRAAADQLRVTLDRLVWATQRRRPVVADLAREVRFGLFDRPVLDEARLAVYSEMDARLAALVAGDDDAAAHVEAIVACPQPMEPRLLLLASEDGSARARRVALELLLRRHYRATVTLLPASAVTVDGDVLVASCAGCFVVTGCGPLDELASLARAVDAVLDPLDESARVRVDLYTWKEGVPPDPDAFAEEARVAVGHLAERASIDHVVVALLTPESLKRASTVRHVTFRPGAEGLTEDRSLRGLHPLLAERLQLWRLANFELERLPSTDDVYLFRGVARENPKDERLFAVAEVRHLTPVRDAGGRLIALPEIERSLVGALEGMRSFQAPRSPAARPVWNRVVLYLWPLLELPVHELEGVARSLAPLTIGLGIEEVLVQCRRLEEGATEPVERVLRLSNPSGTGFVLHDTAPPAEPLAPLDEYTRKVVQSRRRGTVYPYEIVKMLVAPRAGGRSDVLGGTFVEHDLDEHGRLVPVDRPPGRNSASIVTGLVTMHTTRYPEGMTRVVLLGDPTRALGALAEPECRRINAALDLAEQLSLPVEWFALSAGARIAMDSGTENMDWIAAVLRKIIEVTQRGVEINVVVTGINVGAQPYWNAEATMLMHTKGILVMTPDSAMVLTGKQALDYSGGVSAEDNHGIGGYERIMGPNGQAQYWAPDLPGALGVLLAHYDHAYVAPGERFPRRAATSDPFDRDVRTFPHRVPGIDFTTVGDIFSDLTNPDRKQPFDIRTVMHAVLDQDHAVLERWADLRDGDTVAVWDAHLGGIPVCAIGIEAHALPRRGTLPADGPETWTSGTLFPLSSKKTARAVNAASGCRPLVVLANLSGFDGSPESMRRVQLEFGAEIGRAVVNFRGPIVFCVVSRFHGGAFVVFSQRLNESLETLAVEGAHASVIGGAPAAAVVFAGEVDARTAADARVVALQAAVAAGEGPERARLRTELAELETAVRSEKLGEVADEFDAVHSVERAQQMGSVSRIIPAVSLRPLLVDAVERGIARELERTGHAR
ncbi:MAG: fused acetyl/propionyl-CoA carboxylase subunit alpha/methylmalonyl-CoA decarboxylase subunit alpha [Actinomycetota bacterium]|nr:MAG: fused acetyl/propionyl-CoA carboxylase subunit alpha/methylmalonyl-CoA decarboxylase subunit alpha [Actinomycetota bacterium]